MHRHEGQAALCKRPFRFRGTDKPDRETQDQGGPGAACGDQFQDTEKRSGRIADDKHGTAEPVGERLYFAGEATSPNFYSYTADGNAHCIMPNNDFYNREVNGVSFRDWVADFAAGEVVDNVQCETCNIVYGE